MNESGERMETGNLKIVVEAALLAAGRPLNVDQVRELFDERERPTAAEVTEAIHDLAADYEGRALELVEVASGWRAQVRRAYSESVSRLWTERPSRYSRALLETLALIAYRQPITRAEIEEVRGVTVNPNILRTITERGWVRVVGHREAPGRPELLGTTREFLDYFGLKSLDALPTLAELKDMDNVGVQLDFADTIVEQATGPALEETTADAVLPAPGSVADVDRLPEAANDPDATPSS